jgi:CHASE3 domain sensor protein
MTVSTSSPKEVRLSRSSRIIAILESLPGAQFLKNLNIGVKLIIGFGVLVFIALLVAVFSYLGSTPATETINRTTDVRVPTALASANAQANLLRMRGDMRGYLALGESEYRTSYQQSEQAFAADLAELRKRANSLNPDNQRRLNQIEAAFEKWKALPDKLFELRDDQLEREPAYRLLATDGSIMAGNVLIDINTMIERQGQREASIQNLELVSDMAKFQGTFAAMFSALRGYVTTRNRIFRQEYEVNATLNQFAWERLLNREARLNDSQKTLLNNIKQNREAFLQLPETMFELLESERWREDLYLFSAEAVPLTEEMATLLSEMTIDQQVLLQTDLNRGRTGLLTANRQTLILGILALLAGLVLAFIFRESIAGPVGRLTGVAEQIRGGDLEATANVESRDEIGTLADTFNKMTGQLRQTLFQVRKEKKRADDLLNVVIPIGVELSSEKNFNRLLENMLVEAKSFCHANAGALYLREANNLKYVIIRNNAQKIALGGTTNNKITLPPLSMYNEQGQANTRNVAVQTALDGKTINVADTGKASDFDISGPELLQRNGQGGQTITSMLSIPLKNSMNEILGVMQLIDAQDVETNRVVPFDNNIQQMMESFSSLAGAALEAYIRESSLRQEIQQLRIEIDEAKRQQQVSEIVDTDFFQDLQAKARQIRSRGGRGRRASDSAPDEEPSSDS